MSLIRVNFRKAGQYLNNHRLIARLAGAVGAAGAAGTLHKIRQDEQDLVLDAALDAEHEGGDEVPGISS